MKHFYLLALLLVVVPVTAQAVPVSSIRTDTTLVTPNRLTAADTIWALQRLFKKRRTIGSAFVVTAGALTAYGISDVVENGGNMGFYTGGTAYFFVTALAAIYTAPLYIPGLIMRGRYSKKKEAALLAAYNAKKTVPEKYLRKLKPGLFVQPAVK
ncbi:hypothetical protein ACFQT0_25315 [Hymenobacter humi]|uniref:Uncharacterized protein n=1 Tax=Hymenobacter humi TaxID=1411620 RepID=A0ABW2U9W3_9BACT